MFGLTTALRLNDESILLDDADMFDAVNGEEGEKSVCNSLWWMGKMTSRSLPSTGKQRTLLFSLAGVRV